MELANDAARNLRANAGFSVGDATRLCFPDHSFDVAVCMRSLWTFPRPDAALAEMRRVVRPTGTVIVQLWGAPSRNSLLTLGSALLGSRIAALRLRGDELGPFDLTEEWALRQDPRSPLITTHRHRQKITDPDTYWDAFRTVAGSAWLCREELPADARQCIDEDWKVRAQAHARDDGAPGLELEWKVCSWSGFTPTKQKETT